MAWKGSRDADENLKNSLRQEAFHIAHSTDNEFRIMFHSS